MHKGLSEELAQLCPTCGLTIANIKDDEFSCRGGLTKKIVYRARIVGTDTYSAPGLVSLMQSWVGSGRASIMVQSSRLHLDPTCVASLDTLQSSDCPPREQSLLTSPNFEFTETTSTLSGRGSESAEGDGVIVGSISAVVAIVLAIISVLLILVLIMKILNSKQYVKKYGALYALVMTHEHLNCIDKPLFYLHSNNYYCAHMQEAPFSIDKPRWRYQKVNTYTE